MGGSTPLGAPPVTPHDMPCTWRKEESLRKSLSMLGLLGGQATKEVLAYPHCKVEKSARCSRVIF